MALRVQNFLPRLSYFTRKSTLPKLSPETQTTLDRRPIMTSLSRMEKALDHLKTNPYFEKYAKNIAKLQETSPDEFLSRVEQREKRMSEEKTKRQMERKFQQECSAKSSSEPTFGTKKSSLYDIMKMDLIKDKGKEEIIEIWLNYHKSKDCISGIMDPKQFDKMFERGKTFPTFLLPLPREQGYEFIVCQFNGTEVHMTPLIWYQAHKENAPECLTMLHYVDLKETKDVVLMRGEFDDKSMTAREAQCLANELQLYYCTDDPARIDLLKIFTEKPNEFKHMDLIAQLENISLNGINSVSSKSPDWSASSRSLQHRGITWSRGRTKKYDGTNPQTLARSYGEYGDKRKIFYVSTPIFYVNAGPHIGHLYSALLADSMARYNAMLGNETILSTGTDEHGNKVENAAKSAGLPVAEYCGKISSQFREMCDQFDIGYTHFIRTTDDNHRRAVQHFWTTLRERDNIYLGKYSGWYCVQDENFVTSSELAETKNSSGETIKISAESGHPVEWMEEENYKFRLSAFQDDLKYWLKNEEAVRPSNYYKILCDWIEEGSCLEDLSVSRPIKRAPWGIHVPNDDTQTIYVWLDALVNYLTSMGYPSQNFTNKYWPPSIQVIGKDILKFHGIYWPAFLIAAGMEPPKTILCHSHWTVNDVKMSKSKGNVVSPFEVARELTSDGLRYFLLREAVPHTDGNYSDVKIRRVLNSELADTFGNLVSRCMGKIINPAGEIVDPSLHVRTLDSEVSRDLINSLTRMRNESENCYGEFNLHHVVDVVMHSLHLANKMVDYHKPWQLRKECNGGKVEAKIQLEAVVSLALETCRMSALVLTPIVPKLCSNLLDYMRIPDDERSWSNVEFSNLPNSRKVRESDDSSAILFRRIKI